MDVTKSVLVVDCDPSVPVLVRSCLPGADWNIVCADSLSEAPSSLKERAYDLVLTSPRTNGFADVALLRQMRAVRPRLQNDRADRAQHTRSCDRFDARSMPSATLSARLIPAQSQR